MVLTNVILLKIGFVMRLSVIFSDHFFITIFKSEILTVYSQSQTRDDIFQLIALNDITVSDQFEFRCMPSDIYFDYYWPLRNVHLSVLQSL